jgi:hypothetical protein
VAKNDGDEGALRRLGGGRWQTKDGRFTIESQSGSWVVVDAEQTDDLGLARVRGPYPSLAAAREAIPVIRDAAPEESPLRKRIAERPAGGARKGADRGRSRGAAKETEPKEEAPPEPAWLARLPEKRRTEVRRLIRDLEAADLPDPVGIAKRDVDADEPAAASAILVRRVARIVAEHRGGSAKRDDQVLDVVVEMLSWLTTRSRDPDLPMRLPGWRLVEDAPSGRRIELTRRHLVRELERLERRA